VERLIETTTTLWDFGAASLLGTNFLYLA